MRIAYVHRRKPTHNLARKLPSRGRQETRDLVLDIRPDSSRKSASSSIATCARSMGAPILRTNPRIVVSIRKMER
jgi:hypothetical protein